MSATVVCTKASPALMKWCLAESGYTEHDAAKWLGIEVQAYKALENGTVAPTLAQLRKLAEHYKRPVGIFFMPEPPGGLKKPKDYRAHSGTTSPKLLRSIRRARFVQTNLKDFSADISTNMWTPSRSATQSAELARSWLGLTDREQTRNRNVNNFYKHLIDLIEEKNISVLQHSFPEKEAKAYSFAEAPKVVVVSTSDPYMGSRIFSLMHELCHLSHGQSGLCLPNSGDTEYAKERACDRFAAEFLMPRRLVNPIVEDCDKETMLDDDFLRTAAETLKTSRYALLIRLKELEYIDQADIIRKRQAWARIPHRRTGFATTTRSQKAIKENGKPLTQSVISAYNNNQITVSEASYLLNINQSYINEVGVKVAAA